MKFQAILWDLDGTLVDSVADIAAGVNHARTTLGHKPFPIGAVRGFVGDGVHKLIERSFPADEGQKAIALFREFYGNNLLVKTCVYPGLESAVKKFHEAGIRQGVVTNKPTDWAQKIVAGLNLTSYFGIVLGGDHPCGRKPSPAPLELALKTLDRSELSGALMVGDGINDVKSARALGIQVCGVTYGIGQAEEMVSLQPDFLAHSPAEIQTLVLGT
jgi:phosphoglycolate phosphatase